MAAAVSQESEGRDAPLELQGRYAESREVGSERVWAVRWERWEAQTRKGELGVVFRRGTGGMVDGGRRIELFTLLSCSSASRGSGERP